MDPSQPHSTWIEVSTGAIASNVRALLQRVQGQVMAVVKANGYGHGLVTAARSAVRGGASWIGVARAEEGLELRRAGIETPILVLGLTPVGRLDQAIAGNLSLTLWSEEQIEAAAAAAVSLGREPAVHLKVDTGMGRIGARPAEAVLLAQRAQAARLRLEGVYTHFARADEPAAETTNNQLAAFGDVLGALAAAGVKPGLVHAANSAAAIAYPSSHFDLVRAGVAVYGLDPSPTCRLPDGFAPALAWKSILSQVKRLPPGSGISYGHAYVTRGEEQIGTVPVGYGDGFRRVDGNEVLVGGSRVPVVGRVCMDQILVRLDGLPAKVGDEVVIIGRQGSGTISAEDVARRWGTINYEVVCGLSARVARVEV
ncbi:MAG TPA: alanine racemase [Anaerolineales bacterium]|nr:alanine racemase [Anaerolineales bacterium]